VRVQVLHLPRHSGLHHTPDSMAPRNERDSPGLSLPRGEMPHVLHVFRAAMPGVCGLHPLWSSLPCMQGSCAVQSRSDAKFHPPDWHPLSLSCKQPSEKSMQIHFDSKHPKETMDTERIKIKN
jgi:hypothetical protein